MMAVVIVMVMVMVLVVAVAVVVAARQGKIRMLLLRRRGGEGVEARGSDREYVAARELALHNLNVHF